MEYFIKRDNGEVQTELILEIMYDLMLTKKSPAQSGALGLQGGILKGLSH